MHTATHAAGGVVLPLALSALLLGSAAAVAWSQEHERPADVTDESIAWGKQVYFGSPSCVTCHGVKGRGTDEAPNLTDDEWLNGSGTYEEIVKLVTIGVSHDVSKTGREMPMRGWANSATDAEIRAVAAYVWSLRHPKP